MSKKKDLPSELTLDGIEACCRSIRAHTPLTLWEGSRLAGIYNEILKLQQEIAWGVKENQRG